MTNNKISNGTEMCNPNEAAPERAIFIVPSNDCDHQVYAHVEIDDWDKLWLKKLNTVEQQVIVHLFDDVPIADIADRMDVNYDRPIEQIIDKLKQQLGMKTTHGLIARLCRMGIDKLILPKNLT